MYLRQVKVSEKEIELGYRLDRSLTSEEFGRKITKTTIEYQVLAISIKRAKAKRSQLQRRRHSAAAKSSTSWKP
jgi:hypothetical protein